MSDYRQALPIGTLIGGDYRVLGVLGQGGFGLTYQAEDRRLGSPAAVKEYFPSDLAVRDETTTVRARSSREESVFSWGRDKFLEEARTLAKFRHPNIVRVARLFEANNSAYMVLDFEAGPNLSEWRTALGRAPPQRELDRIAAGLLDAVETVHNAGVLHRDIKPANIIMRGGTHPVLIDFGAARQSFGARSKTVHAIVTPGYSPKEQYALDVDRQGPWSDIYALGATLYFLLVGKAPADALSRDLQDAMPMATDGDEPYRPSFIAAIEHAMQIHASDRPRSIAEWRVELLGDAHPPGSAFANHDETDDAGPRFASGSQSARALFSGKPASGPYPNSGSPANSRPRSRPSHPRRSGALLVSPAVAPSHLEAPAHRSKLPLLAAFAVAALITGGIWAYVLVLGPNQDRAQWLSAENAHTVQAYDAYLAARPNGQFAAEARSRRAAVASAPGATGSRSALGGGAEPKTSSATLAPATSGGAGFQPSAQPQPPPPSTPSQLPLPAPSLRETPQIIPPTTPAAATAPPSTAPAAVQPPPFQPPPTPQKSAANIPQPPLPAPPASDIPLVSPPSEPPQSKAADPPRPPAIRRVPERPTLPGALSQAQIDQARQAANAAEFRLASSVFLAGNVPGYSEQSSDFIAELGTLSGTKIKAVPFTAADAPPVSEIVNGSSRSVYMGWHSPVQSISRGRLYAVLSGELPFGLAPPDHLRWLQAEGANLLERAYWRDGFGVRAIPCGIGGSPGGWFSREIKTLADLQGLKVSVAALSSAKGTPIWAQALEKAAAVPVSIGRDYTQAFSTQQVQAVFAASWNQYLSIFLKAPVPAPIYHSPGVHQPSFVLDLLIGANQWNTMSVPQQQLIDEACRRTITKWAGQAQATQNNVLQQIRAQRVTVRPIPSQVLDALRQYVTEVLDAESAQNSDFGDVVASYNKFRR